MSERCEYCGLCHIEEKTTLIEKIAFGHLKRHFNGIKICKLCIPNSNSLCCFTTPCCGETLHVKCYVQRLNNGETCCRKKDIDLRHIWPVSNGVELCYICFKELNTKDLKIVQLNCCGRHVCSTCIVELREYEKNHNHYIDAIIKFKCMCGEYIIPNGIK